MSPSSGMRTQGRVSEARGSQKPEALRSLRPPGRDGASSPGKGVTPATAGTVPVIRCRRSSGDRRPAEAASTQSRPRLRSKCLVDQSDDLVAALSESHGCHLLSGCHPSASDALHAEGTAETAGSRPGGSPPTSCVTINQPLTAATRGSGTGPALPRLHQGGGSWRRRRTAGAPPRRTSRRLVQMSASGRSPNRRGTTHSTRRRPSWRSKRRSLTRPSSTGPNGVGTQEAPAHSATRPAGRRRGATRAATRPAGRPRPAAPPRPDG